MVRFLIGFPFLGGGWGLHRVAGAILVPGPRIELTPLAVRGQSSNYQTARELPRFPFFFSSTLYCLVTKSCLTFLQPHRLQPARLLSPWDFPGQNTGAGCHLLLQGIFPTQGSNPRLPHWQVGSLPLSHQGSPLKSISI